MPEPDEAPRAIPLEFLDSLLGAIPAFVTWVDEDFKILYINLEQQSLSSDRVVGHDVFEFIEPDHHATARGCFASVLQTGKPGTYMSRAAGRRGTADYENHVSAVTRGGTPMGLCIIGMDVTERLAQARQRAASEERHRLAVEATGLGMWSQDLVTGEHFWSPRMTEICGLAGPVDLERFLDIVHPDDRAISRESNVALMRVGHFESRVRIQVSGRERWVHTRGRATFDESGTPVRIAGGMLDVTDQQELERKVRRQHRLEAVGQMTAGVAHNFNNMLMALIPSLDLLADQVTPAGRVHLEAARGVAHRAAEIVAKLMTFASSEPAKPSTPIPLAAAVSTAVDMAQSTFGGLIDVDVQVIEDGLVAAEADDIVQLVMNLLLNARDALIDAAKAQPRIEVQVERARDGGNLRVRVADNGPGIGTDVIDHIFEPFFTTKGGRGTGLGLASSHAIARRAGGSLRARSVPGHGAEFVLLLPRVGPRAVETTAPVPAPSPPLRDRGRVLVVDDDPLVRRVMERALSRAGFEVVTVDGVQSARELLQHDRTFDVALIDRHMPGEHGRIVVPHLRAQLPTCAVAFLTGNLVTDEERAMVDLVLMKPLTASELVTAVRRLAAMHGA